MLLIYNSSILSVDNKSESLGEYVRRIRVEKNLSTLDVERQSGYKITDGYVSRIENGGVKNVSPEKLKALAKGLDVTEEEIFAVARGKDPNEDPNFKKSRFAKLHFTYEKLSPKKQAAYDRILELAERELERIRRERDDANP